MAELKYKTFDQLMAAVSEDLHLYADNNLIIPRRYIQTIREVNTDLGLRINKQKDRIIPIKNYKGELPADMLSVISVIATSVKSMGFIGPPSFGTQIRIYNREEIINRFGDKIPPGCTNSCGECYWVTRSWEDKEILYQDIYPLKPTPASFNYFTQNSPNRRCTTDEYFIDITDGDITVNFCDGEIYMVYLSDMVDEESNLLLLDHAKINPYYEWAVKKKVFEDLWHNTEADVEKKYYNARDVELPRARKEAQGLIGTPEYYQINQHTNGVIQKFYDRYIKIFL